MADLLANVVSNWRLEMLENKRIIVTGCGRGMGEATLLAYVAAGAKVVGMDINQKLGTAVVTQANANASDQAHFLPVDVANEQKYIFCT